MKRYIVLGGYGIIGRAVVKDLFRFAKDSEIVVAGRDGDKAEDFAKSFKSKRVISKKVDIGSSSELVNLLRHSDVCLNCVQYNFNLDIMSACIKAKTNYVDLGGMFHMTKEQLLLCKDFIMAGKCAILGVGGAPGISNILARYGGDKLKEVRNIEIAFADVDYTDYNKAFVLPYSFKTLVGEFTFKPAILRDGKILFVESRSGFKEYNFGREFGKKNGFLTLHSEIATLPDYFESKGIRNCEFRVTFPDSFSQAIKLLIELGFASEDKIKWDKEIKTIDITARIMDRLIPPQDIKIRDKEIIRVILNGSLIMDAITESDGRTSAGVLDTGIPCSIAAQMIAGNKICKSGVFSPEQALNPSEFFKELKRRKIKVYENGMVIN